MFKLTKIIEKIIYDLTSKNKHGISGRGSLTEEIVESWQREREREMADEHGL